MVGGVYESLSNLIFKPKRRNGYYGKKRWMTEMWFSWLVLIVLIRNPSKRKYWGQENQKLPLVLEKRFTQVMYSFLYLSIFLHKNFYAFYKGSFLLANLHAWNKQKLVIWNSILYVYSHIWPEWRHKSHPLYHSIKYRNFT